MNPFETPDTESTIDPFKADNTPAPVTASLPATGSFGQLIQQAEFLSKSTIIPAVYQNKPANCFIALEFAQRLNCNFMTTVQNLDIIMGRPSWSSKFLIAQVNECGRFDPIRYRFTGTQGKEDWGCIAFMTEKKTGQLLEGPEVTIGMARKAGWLDKKGSYWQISPHLMLQYRSATFLIRTYAPEFTLGLHTTEEVQDMKNLTPNGPIPATKTAAEIAWENQNVSETT